MTFQKIGPISGFTVYSTRKNSGEDIKGGLYDKDNNPMPGHNTEAPSNGEIEGGLYNGNKPVSPSNGEIEGGLYNNNNPVPGQNTESLESTVALLLGIRPEVFHSMPESMQQKLVDAYNRTHPDNPIGPKGSN